MTDRVPGAPGRCKAVVTGQELGKLQSGEEFAITLRRDDQPIKEGTPYSKAAVLPDELAAKLCPQVQDPTPKDAFAALQKNKADTVRHRTGTAIILQDAAHTPLMGLKLYRKNLFDMEASLNDVFTKDGDVYTGFFDTEGKRFGKAANVFIPKGSTIFFSAEILETNTVSGKPIQIDFAYENGGGFQLHPGTYGVLKDNIIKMTPYMDWEDINCYTKFKNPQVEIGTTATAYVPYFGGGDVTVRVTGKNLWTAESTIVPVSNNQSGSVTLCDLPIGVPLTLSADITKYPDDTATNTRITFFCDYTDGTRTEGVSAFDSDNSERDGVARKKSATITIDADKAVKEIRCILLDYSNQSRRNAKAENIQLEIGDTATAYEPCKEQTLTVSVPNGLGSDGFVCEDLAQLHTCSPNTIITNDAGVGMEVIYYTPSTAVQMVHSPADKDKLLSIDEHGCVILVERESVTEKAKAALEQLETDVRNLDISDGALYAALSRHEEDTSNPHNVTADQLDMADFVMEQDTSGDMKWRRWKSGLAECWGEMSVSAEGSPSNMDHCNLFSYLPLYFTHFDSVQVTVLSTNTTDPGDSQYADILSNLFMSVFNIDAEAELERLVVRFGIISAGSYNMLDQAVSNVRLSVRVSGTVW